VHPEPSASLLSAYNYPSAPRLVSNILAASKPLSVGSGGRLSRNGPQPKQQQSSCGDVHDDNLDDDYTRPAHHHHNTLDGTRTGHFGHTLWQQLDHHNTPCGHDHDQVALSPKSGTSIADAVQIDSATHSQLLDKDTEAFGAEWATLAITTASTANHRG
jgi:hypothetical protein